MCSGKDYRSFHPKGHIQADVRLQPHLTGCFARVLRVHHDTQNCPAQKTAAHYPVYACTAAVNRNKMQSQISSPFYILFTCVLDNKRPQLNKQNIPNKTKTNPQKERHQLEVNTLGCQSQLRLVSSLFIQTLHLHLSIYILSVWFPREKRQPAICLFKISSTCNVCLPTPPAEIPSFLLKTPQLQGRG